MTFCSLNSSYICFSTSLSWSRKKIARMSLRPLKTLQTMKVLVTRAKRVRAVAAATMAVTTAKLLGAMGVLRRLTSWARCLSELCAPSRLPMYILYIRLVFLNSCFVNFNLRRSCKLDLRRTWCHYGFIAIKCLLVAKRGACSKKLIPNKISPIFGLKLRLSFLWDASIFLHFSCFVRRKVLHPRLRVPRGFRRRNS
jgi:hypothetical protein